MGRTRRRRLRVAAGTTRRSTLSSSAGRRPPWIWTSEPWAAAAVRTAWSRRGDCTAGGSVARWPLGGLWLGRASFAKERKAAARRGTAGRGAARPGRGARSGAARRGAAVRRGSRGGRVTESVACALDGGAGPVERHQAGCGAADCPSEVLLHGAGLRGGRAGSQDRRLRGHICIQWPRSCLPPIGSVGLSGLCGRADGRLAAGRRGYAERFSRAAAAIWIWTYGPRAAAAAAGRTA